MATKRQPQPGELPPDYSGEEQLSPPEEQMAEPQAPAPAVRIRQGPTSDSGSQEEGRSFESPRERAAPRKPTEPTPMAGSTQMAGIKPFKPLASAPVGQYVNARSGLYGGAGGLQGGGLGVPLDPISNATSDPISSLIEALLRGRNG